jgi:hypothetical protein
MKTMTAREFFQSPGRMKRLPPGQSVLVTDKGRPSLVVTKAGTRPVKTLEMLEREAREICPEERPKVNFTEWRRRHKK